MIHLLARTKKTDFFKTQRQIMHALNIKKNTQKQTKTIFDHCKNSLENIIDSNIDNSVSGKNNTLQASKPSTQVF